jgi:hypothetical protein
MLLALGAASAALDAIKSLTAPKPASSQPIGFGPAGAVRSDDSAPSVSGSTVPTGYSNAPRISPDNISALLAAQSHSSGLSSGATGADSPPLPTTTSGAASSAYSALNQLIQSQPTPAPLGLPPISV